MTEAGSRATSSSGGPPGAAPAAEQVNHGKDEQSSISDEPENSKRRSAQDIMPEEEMSNTEKAAAVYVDSKKEPERPATVTEVEGMTIRQLSSAETASAAGKHLGTSSSRSFSGGLDILENESHDGPAGTVDDGDLQEMETSARSSNLSSEIAEGESGSQNTEVASLKPQETEGDPRTQLAAEVTKVALQTDHDAYTLAVSDVAHRKNESLPETPPPPIPPRKDSMPKTLHSIGSRFDDKGGPNSDVLNTDIPEPPQGQPDSTGIEIQDIMGQFRDGMGGMGEEEIMSPRLERQQSALVLPPRSSSLEPKEVFTVNSPSSAAPVTSPLSPQGTGKSAMPQSGVSRVRADDQESIKSGTAGSIFQPPPPSPDPEPALPFDFHRFLEQLRHRTADPVARFLRSFLNEFAKKQWMVHEQVKIISDFLEFITKKMGQCEVWRTVSDAEFDNAREGMEKLVMNRLYTQTFSPAIQPIAGSPRKNARGRSQVDGASPHGPGRRGQHQEDVERDDVIAQKIRIYGWIREEHLDIKPVSDKGKKFLALAQQELLKINTYRAPRDKVICVLNCCKVIFGFLRNAKADQSADSFVPLLIYTVLRARPDHLVSNVQYIWRFRNQEKLGGEAGYYMSSLMGVVSFIENLDRTTLTITDEEFEINVEQAVSAIAEKNRAEEYESRAHSSAGPTPGLPPNEKTPFSTPEASSRDGGNAERSAPHRSLSQRVSEKISPRSHEDDDSDAMSGLLKTIQKPLNTIGRIFSDDSPSSHPLHPPVTPQPGSSPNRGLSPGLRFERRSSADSEQQRKLFQPAERRASQPDNAQAAAARQASVEAAQAQRLRADEHKVVVE